MIDPRTVAPTLAQDTEGLWRPPHRSQVDYPDEGNAFCFQVEDHSFWFQHRNACILEAVRRVPPSGPIFDVGGGNGFVARGLTTAGFPSIVVEPGESGARNARARGLSPVICGALDDVGFRPGSLAAAGLFDVLEHIQDDAGVLSTLASLIVPGGALYLTVPAYQWLWSGEDDLGGHHRRYTIGGLTRLVSGAGFRVEMATYMFWPLPLPIALIRALPWRLGARPTVDLDAIRKELRPPQGIAVKALASLLNVELGWIRRGHKVPAGGSCLLAARRVP